MANNSKPLLNYFSSEELLTAQKLNKALDILSNVDDKLKAMIDLKADASFVTQSIDDAGKNYLKLYSDTEQEVSSNNEFSGFNYLKNRNALGNVTFIKGDLWFEVGMFEGNDNSEELDKIIKTGTQEDYFKYLEASYKGTPNEGLGPIGYYSKEGYWYIPTIVGAYSDKLTIIGDAVVISRDFEESSKKVSAIYESEINSNNKYQTKKEVSELIRESRFMEWDPLYSFEKGDIVTTPNYIYISLQDNNLGYAPQDNPDWWKIYQTNLDNYFTRQYIENNYVPLSSLSKYSGSGYVNMKINSSIEENELITLPFRYHYGKANLICTVGGVIQTLDLDYKEVEDKVTNDGTSNQVQMLTKYDLSTTGTLEFRTLPYGKLIDSVSINDDVASKISTYSSAKLESLKEDLIRYVSANTAMSASNWTFTFQEIFKDGTKKFNRASDWNKIGVLNLTINDIWPKSTEVIDVKPYRLIQIYANGAYFEGFVNDAKQEQVVLTSSTQSFKTYKIIFDKAKEEFFVDSDLDLAILQVLIFQARVLTKFDDNPDIQNSIIDDSRTLIDKTWSSLKIQTSLDGVEKLVNDKAEIAKQNKVDLQSQIETIKTFTSNQTEAVKNLVNTSKTQLTTNFNNQLRTVNQKVNTLDTNFKTKLNQTAQKNYVDTKITNAKTQINDLKNRLDNIKNVKKFEFTLGPNKLNGWFSNPFQKQSGFTGATDWYMMPCYSYLGFSDWRNNFGFNDAQKTEFQEAMNNAVGAFVFPNNSNGSNLWHQLENIRFSDDGNNLEITFWPRNWWWANDGAIKRIEYLFVIYYLEG